MIVVVYALGASTTAWQGALVQQVNAVESLRRIDVLCMDKTSIFTALQPDRPDTTIEVGSRLLGI